MAADKKQQERDKEQVPGNDPMHGRTHNSQNPEVEEQSSQRDISKVDQQEGNMHRGETGDRLTQKEER